MLRSLATVTHRTIVSVLCAVMLITTAGFWFAGAVAQPVIVPAFKGEQCVADTNLMRSDHMKLLDHQRDDTVIDGVRGAPYSLIGCVDCHAQRSDSGAAIRVDAEGQFCQSCHAYAAVKIDCFSCHAAVPEQARQIGLLPDNPMPHAEINRVMSLLKSTDYHAKEQQFFTTN